MLSEIGHTMSERCCCIKYVPDTIAPQQQSAPQSKAPGEVQQPTFTYLLQLFVSCGITKKPNSLGMFRRNLMSAHHINRYHFTFVYSYCPSYITRSDVVPRLQPQRIHPPSIVYSECWYSQSMCVSIQDKRPSPHDIY